MYAKSILKKIIYCFCPKLEKKVSPNPENYFLYVYCFFFFFSIAWIIAGLAAIPYFLFTKLNYLDYPTGSEKFLQDSAFCAMLKTPKVI